MALGAERVLAQNFPRRAASLGKIAAQSWECSIALFHDRKLLGEVACPVEEAVFCIEKENANALERFSKMV